MRLLPPAPPSLAWLLLALLTLGGPALAAEPDPRPFEEQPYLGLSVRDGPGDTLVVGWVLPGPLPVGEGDVAPAIRRDDNVVSLDGVARDAAGFREYLKTKKPGDEVTLVVRRSPEASPDKAIPTGGPGGEERTLKVVLAKRSDWAGTLGRGLRKHVRLRPPLTGKFEHEIREQAQRLGLMAGDEGVGGGLGALLTRLHAVQEDSLDMNSVKWVVSAFRGPLALDVLESALATKVLALRETPENPATVQHALGEILDVHATMNGGGLALGGSSPGAWWLRQIETPERDVQAPALMRLVRTLRDQVSPFGPHAEEHIRTIGVDIGPRAEQLIAAASACAAIAAAGWETQGRGLADRAKQATFARDYVDGEVLWIGMDEDLGCIAVVGGAGPNRYDMSQIGVVYDVGGDDVYSYSGDAVSPVTIVIDLAGNDLHESATDFQGPATSVLGVSWLDDRGGNDTYRSTGQGSIAVGIGGIGVLIDHAGDDLYENRGPGAGWSMGVGFYGAGILIDRAGHDTYRGEKLCQGVGGPLGLGLVLDVAGNDRYDADGPSFPSAYGTPGVHVGMSQGFGYGVRGYAAGGVGALYDLAGDDRYTAGEFSQGGGYYFALGVLHDCAGNDLYHGNRYGQAFAAHQAIGILVDDAGDDTYWSMTAASQSGAWDESITLLLDKQGDDSYRCDGLGQGSAAMQAIALLVDLGGRDRYIGRGGSVQGQGGGNSYHYDADKVFSFNALLDLGGSEDVYSSGRANNSVVRTGKLNEPARADSDLYGLFLDR